MRPFLICLSPAILGFILVLIVVSIHHRVEDALLYVAMVLFWIGALLSGGCVARKIVHRSSERTWVTWLGAVFAFFGVAIAYLGMTMGGCSAVMMTQFQP